MVSLVGFLMVSLMVSLMASSIERARELGEEKEQELAEADGGAQLPSPLSERT